MSHALVIVALRPQDLQAADNDIQRAVSEQMAPFDENQEFFRDGSRWDWWVIGGRYSGRLLGENMIYRRDLTDARVQAYQDERAKETWKAFLLDLAEHKPGDEEFLRNVVYGFEPGETEETLTARFKTRKLTAYAYLCNRHWHEGERMGWWGTATGTECERADETHEGKCLFQHEETGARIISWSEDNETWAAQFYDRFIKPLPENYLLVGVDYHV